MKTIYFIRHGQTKYNVEGRFVGSTDLPLTENGRKNIYDLWHERSKHIDKEVIYSSPMKRCIETAHIIFPDEHLEIIKNMREMNFGVFEGKTHDELMDMQAYRNFRATSGKEKIPHGESGIEFGMRVLKGFFEMIGHMNKNSNGKSLWYAKVTASFYYDGSTSSCTSSSASGGSYVSTWKILSKSSSRTGNVGSATVTAGSYYVGILIGTITETVTLACDKNGNLS